MMSAREFHNGLRILTGLNMHELVDGGVIEAGDKAAWAAFRKDPYRWLILADDDKANALWAIMKRPDYSERTLLVTEYFCSIHEDRKKAARDVLRRVTKYKDTDGMTDALLEQLWNILIG
jgi:hypothetical protein